MPWQLSCLCMWPLAKGGAAHRAGREGSQDDPVPAGLPSDQLSVENALVITQSIRTAFIIDPSSQAPNWLQAHMQAQKAVFETATMHDERCALYMPAL